MVAKTWLIEKMNTFPKDIQIEPKNGQETATFALGCFWGPDQFFSGLDGVVDVVVGYTGGDKENPTYNALGDHSEAVRIIYNPEEISYRELLAYFWNRHNPTVGQKVQYRSVIFYHNEKQMSWAEESLEEMQDKYAEKILTSIEPVGTFYPAEEYHQDYLEKQK